MPSKGARFVFLGSRPGIFDEARLPQVTFCHKRSEVKAELSGAAKHITWVSFSTVFTDILLEKTLAIGVGLHQTGLITLKPPRRESIPALVGMFHPVCGIVEGFRWLPSEELAEALTRDDAGERLIGGSVDFKAKCLTLLRGNLEIVVAPLTLFSKSGDGIAPDFQRLRLTDYGRTVALGQYEASADSILYELDGKFRSQLNKQRKQSEQSFGASLSRLRKQRRLKRTDFEPLSSKAIARIERGEICKPHAKTLGVIAHRLGVPPDEIQTY